MPADPVAAPTIAPDERRSRTVGWVVAVLALVAVLPLLYERNLRHHFLDLKIYMSAMDWWRAGHPLYDYVQPDPVQGELFFTYPPFSALLLWPFGLLPLGLTIATFVVLTVVAVIVTTRWLVAPLIARYGLPPVLTPAVAVLLVLAMEGTRETIAFGQINMLLVVLILADLLFAVPRARRWAGVGIGLATALKLFPGIFIVYLLVTRRFRAAVVAAATATAATLLAAAVAPRDSWRFWTHELWDSDRVGRPDYTGNQSLFGLLSRLTAPERASQLLWLLLAALVAGYGLWRAARAARAGDELTGITLTGLVGGLVSPITWTHHIYWFAPAVVLLVDSALGAGSDPAGRRRRWWFAALAAATTLLVGYGVVSFQDWGIAPVPTDTPGEFVSRNEYVLLALLLLVALPVRRTAARKSAGTADDQRGRAADGPPLRPTGH